MLHGHMVEQLILLQELLKPLNRLEVAEVSATSAACMSVQAVADRS